MTWATRWSARFAHWQSMPARAHVAFLIGVFLIFAPSGLLTDIPRLGADAHTLLLVNAAFAGLVSVGYVLAIRRWWPWLFVVIAAEFLIPTTFNRLFGAPGPPLAGDALRARLGLDVGLATLSIVLGFACLSFVIRSEAARHGRVETEIALARDIHRRLVPRVERRIGRFEFRGVAVPSGAVGGDLVDVVESPGGWTSFVADVSGHGVGAGLLMGMVKSAARTELRTRGDLDDLLRTLNSVLFDLKSPTMFATFAGLQWSNDPGALRFTVAGHLPILHYRACAADVAELSISQLPLAMFGDTTFTSALVDVGAGDLFVILTDGFTEVFDRHDREFGLDRVKALIAEHGQAPLAAIETHLLAAVHAHGKQLDDQTLLLVRVA